METTKCANGSEEPATKGIKRQKSTTPMRPIRVDSKEKLLKPVLVLPRFMECFTAQQWAMLSSVLIFTINAVLAIITVVVFLNYNESKHLLENEIMEETSDSNKRTLQLSLDTVKRTEVFLTPFVFVVWIHLVSTGVLIYGVVSKSIWCIFQWIILSSVLSVTSFIAIIVVLNEVQHILWYNITTRRVLFIVIWSMLVFIPMWALVLRYYRLLRANISIKKGQTVHVSDGGYIHVLEDQHIRKV